MNYKKVVYCLVVLLMVFVSYTEVFAETKQANNELIQKVTGQKPGEVNLDIGDADEAAIDSGVAIAEVASKVSVLVFFVSLLIQLVGKVIQHPGYQKWSRLLILGSITGFIVIRMAPIALYGM